MTWLQFAIAADQLLNTAIPPYSGEQQGWADETLSSRAWRLSGQSPRWERMRKVIDGLFLKLFKQKSHCFEAYMAERLGRQLPPELRNNTPQ